MITATCPECKNPIKIDSTPKIGQLLKCGNCQTQLEVTWLFPVSLDYHDDERNKPSDHNDFPE